MSFTVTKPADKRIVVMLGSFNPPTIAHLNIMKQAVESVNAEKGIFVPLSQDYVIRKYKRQHRLHDAFKEEVRIEMIESIRREDERFLVSMACIRNPELEHTFDILKEIQKENPDSEIFLTVDSDIGRGELEKLPEWYRIDELLEEFRIIIVAYNYTTYYIERLKEENSFFAEHWNDFKSLWLSDEFNVHSSSFLYYMHMPKTSGSYWDECAKRHVTSDVWEIISERRKFTWQGITDFTDTLYCFLSNNYEVLIEYGGFTYGSAEAAYQAQKCITDKERIRFTHYTPELAHEEGQKVKLRPDWEKVKLSIMEEVVYAKFTQNPAIGKKLYELYETNVYDPSTYHIELTYVNSYRSTFWGIDIETGEGTNHLGNILMYVREKIRQKIFDNNIDALARSLDIFDFYAIVKALISSGEFDDGGVYLEYCGQQGSFYLCEFLGEYRFYFYDDEFLRLIEKVIILHKLNEWNKKSFFSVDANADAKTLAFKYTQLITSTWGDNDCYSDFDAFVTPVKRRQSKKFYSRARRSSGWKSQGHRRKQWEHKVIEHEKHEYRRKNLPLCTERNDLYDDEEQDCINGRQL